MLSGVSAFLGEIRIVPKQYQHKSPGKFDDVKRPEFLRLLADGKSKALCAHSVGVAITTVERYCNLHAEFRREVSRAEMVGARLRVGKVEDSLFNAAVSGNVTAIQVFLYNRASERWSDRRQVKTEMTGPGGGPIQTKTEVIQIGSDTIREAIGALVEAGAIRVSEN